MLTGRKISWLTAATALAVRAVFALAAGNSCFVNYHLVRGLDMQTLLRVSEWFGKDALPAFFTFHRLMIFLIWRLNGGNHCVWAIFAVQSAVGILGTVCIADIVRRLTGRRTVALLCGIAAALYLPSLVYEFSVLKEAFAVNFSLFAFWSMLYAMWRRFSWGSAALTGAACFMAVEGRLAVVPYLAAIMGYVLWKMYRRGKAARVLRTVAVTAVLLAAASGFNRANGGKVSPFFDVLDYNMMYNFSPEASFRGEAREDEEIGTGRAAGKTASSAMLRAPRLFKSGELPENQNIYFWCEKIPQLHLLIAPGALLPCACAGIMVLLCSGAWKGRYGLLLLPLLTLTLPLCVREPIGRYRLMLVPYFFMSAACGAAVFAGIRSAPKRAVALLGAGVGAFFSIHGGEAPLRIRPSDHCAWAMALEETPGAEKEEIVKAYLNYWHAGTPPSKRAFIVVMDKLLAAGTLETALETAKEGDDAGIDPDLTAYFRAWCFALAEQPAAVDGFLRTVRHPENLPPELQKKYLMLRRDTDRILNIRRK